MPQGSHDLSLAITRPPSPASTPPTDAGGAPPGSIAVDSRVVQNLGIRLAKVEQQKALLDQAELNLKYTTIVAPIDGVVGKKNVAIGQNVSTGQEMMAVVPVEGLWVTANFKETQLQKMRVGQPVKIKVDAYDREYTGKVLRIAGASGARFSLLPPENATGNYVKVVQRIPVRIALDPGQDNDHLLRQGMSVTPTVQLQ